ncbi:hypothetical protein VPH35_007271 [Triticum aestivum]
MSSHRSTNLCHALHCIFFVLVHYIFFLLTVDILAFFQVLVAVPRAYRCSTMRIGHAVRQQKKIVDVPYHYNFYVFVSAAHLFRCCSDLLSHSSSLYCQV